MEGVYYRGGKYENYRGFLVLDAELRGTDSSVTVKLGLNATQIKFPLRYIWPETTTEREGAISASGSVCPYCVRRTGGCYRKGAVR
jgi:hypothetical protein